MPELPEAETIARGLRSDLCGRMIGEVILNRPDILHGDMGVLDIAVSGRRVADVFRRGKRVLIKLDDGTTLVFALGMTGRLTTEPATAPCLPHTHLRMFFDAGARELRFRDPRRFGGIWVVKAETEERSEVGPKRLRATKTRTRRDQGTKAWRSDGRQLSPLGDEPLEINVRRFRDLLRRKRRIKGLLLDQRVIAGLGNIYCDESLHRAGIHPLTLACDLTNEQSAALLRQIRLVLRSAITHGGSTFMDYRDSNGRPGRFQHKHRVYNRRGQPCRRCKTPIQRITIAARSTHLCPTCQPPPD